MYARLAIIVAILLVLAGTYWRGYTRGEKAVQLAWDADTALRTAAALQASEQARAKEQALQTANRRISHAFAQEQSRRAAADLAAADSLQRLNAALVSGGAGGQDPTTGAGADGDPRNGIIAECASALVRLDGAHRGLVAQTRALQDYTGSVCVSPE